jgi:hypothetical protein
MGELAERGAKVNKHRETNMHLNDLLHRRDRL